MYQCCACVSVLSHQEAFHVFTACGRPLAKPVVWTLLALANFYLPFHSLHVFVVPGLPLPYGLHVFACIAFYQQQGPSSRACSAELLCLQLKKRNRFVGGGALAKVLHTRYAALRCLL